MSVTSPDIGLRCVSVAEIAEHACNQGRLIVTLELAILFFFVLQHGY